MKTDRRKRALRRGFARFFIPVLCVLLAAACSYGTVGGADQTATFQDGEGIQKILDPMRGVWYSRYGGRKLDGFRIGKWEDRGSLIPPALRGRFPQVNFDSPRFKTPGSALPLPGDYFVCFDDGAYETNPGDGGGGGWGYRYIGIVRAVNVFNGDPKTGAVIIEYLDGAYPSWSAEVRDTPLPFFGFYYRILGGGSIQMANAVDLAAMRGGKPYHTETATLVEAAARNNAANGGEFISWGDVIPQEKEP